MNGADAERALESLRAALNERRKATSDPTEKAALLHEVEKINRALSRLADADARAVALLIEAAAADLDALLATAQLNPFDAKLRRAVEAIKTTASRAAEDVGRVFVPRNVHAIEEDAASPVPDFTPPGAAPVRPLPDAAPDALPPVVRGTSLAALAADYAACWDACRIHSTKRAIVERSADRLLLGRARYEAVSARCNRVPWQLIGILHGLECGYDFARHLHNGDPLEAPTRREPRGRPPGWTGTGSWEDSAVDALEHMNLHKVGIWAVPQVLYALECFNGFGYRNKGLRSPYLWSFSNLYKRGKFVADHKFDPRAVSKQVGSAVLLKVLEERDLWPRDETRPKVREDGQQPQQPGA